MKPSFWTDSILAGLPEATRLFYVGLWMIADDAGWFRADVPELANQLYGYEPTKRREARVSKMLAGLTVTRRIVLHPCGHGQVPTLTAHQHLAGATKQVRTTENEHLRQCVARSSPPPPADARESSHTPATVRLGNGQERYGQSRSGVARETDEALATRDDEDRREANLRPLRAVR